MAKTFCPIFDLFCPIFNLFAHFLVSRRLVLFNYHNPGMQFLQFLHISFSICKPFANCVLYVGWCTYLHTIDRVKSILAFVHSMSSKVTSTRANFRSKMTIFLGENCPRTEWQYLAGHFVFILEQYACMYI